MYHAKNKGRNNYQFFTGDMSVEAVERPLPEGIVAAKAGAAISVG